MTPPIISRILAAGILSAPIGVLTHMKELQKQAEIADPVAYAMKQKQVSTTAITYYLYYPATFITLGLLVGANELIALALRLSLLQSKSR